MEANGSWQWMEIHGNPIWGPWLEVSLSYDPPDNYQPLQMNTFSLNTYCTGEYMLRSQHLPTTSLLCFTLFPCTIKLGHLHSPLSPLSPPLLLPLQWLQNVNNRLTGLVIGVSSSKPHRTWPSSDSGRMADHHHRATTYLVHKDDVNLQNLISTCWQANVLGDKKFFL